MTAHIIPRVSGPLGNVGKTDDGTGPTSVTAPVVIDPEPTRSDEQDGKGRDPSARGAPAWSRWLPRLLPPLLYLLASIYCYSEFVREPLQRYVGGADGVAYAWYFEWTHQSFLHAYNPFVTTALNAPFGVNLMWNTSLFLLSVVCLPLTMTIGPFATVGLLFVLAPFLSATSAYLVFRAFRARA